MKSGRLLTLSQLAKQWGWSISKLHRLVLSKQIPHQRFGKGRVYFEESVVEAWLEARRIGPTKTTTDPPPPDDDLDAELARFGLDRRECRLLDR